MVGIIVEIGEKTARVDVGQSITGYLPFMFVPVAGQSPDFDYKLGDQVIIHLFGTLDQGVILGVIR